MFFSLKISSSILKIYPVLLFSFLEVVVEVAVCRRSAKQMFLKPLRNSWESTYAGVSLFNKVVDFLA